MTKKLEVVLVDCLRYSMMHLVILSRFLVNNKCSFSNHLTKLTSFSLEKNYIHIFFFNRATFASISHILCSVYVAISLRLTHKYKKRKNLEGTEDSLSLYTK